MRVKDIVLKSIVGSVAVLLGLAGAARAQDNPEAGDVAPPSDTGSASGSMSGSASWQSPSSPVETSGSSSSDVGGTSGVGTGTSDHANVVGHLGVGFFGVMGVPTVDATAAPAPDTLNAPTVGVRYWLSDGLGVEAALGLNISSRDLSGTVSASDFGLALHGGVPLALASSQHFVFEVVPVLNFGIASGSVDTTMAGMTATTDVSGFLIEVGAKVGAEVHFGFIDLPNLSLQGTLGLTVRHENRSITLPGANNSTDLGTTAITTGVDGEPWDIFTGNIAAIYYL